MGPDQSGFCHSTVSKFFKHMQKIEMPESSLLQIYFYIKPILKGGFQKNSYCRCLKSGLIWISDRLKLKFRCVWNLDKKSLVQGIFVSSLNHLIWRNALALCWYEEQPFVRNSGVRFSDIYCNPGNVPTDLLSLSPAGTRLETGSVDLMLGWEP